MGTTVFEMASPKREPLTGPEKGRAHKLYKMMDIDKSGSIDVDEICIVHDSDKDSMIAQLDANGDKQVDKDEWNGYLEAKKAEKGPKRFEFFLKYLEVEIPKHLPEMKLHVEKKKKNPSQKTKAVKKQKAPKKSKEADPFGAFAPAEDGKDLADVLMGRCAFTARGVPVPENVAKKRATQEAIAGQKAEEATIAKKSRAAKRVQAYRNAEEYTREYRALARQQVRMKRQAKAAGNHFVDAEAKLIFVVRIRGLADMHPKTKKILQLMRLRQMNMGVFMKVSKAATEMLKRVEPYLSYGYPNLKSVQQLIYKRGFGKVNKNRIPLNDNAVVEGSLGKYGIKCMEDLIHEIYTVGPHFREANNFLWPFKLRPARHGQAKKRKGFCEGGQAGNREFSMNNLIQRML